MNADLVTALKAHQAEFNIRLDEGQIDQLVRYYELIQGHNSILHLVGPSSAEEFATRHILESLALLEFLPMQTTLADVGAGAGLPSIPCLIVREGLSAILIESKEKKANFLILAIEELGLAGRATVLNKQFEESEPGLADFVTCRALDKFTKKLPKLLKWSGKRGLLFFGGESLAETLQANKVRYVQKLMPLSERRFLFVRK